MTSSSFWKHPELRHDEERQIEHKVSWLELFFDLLFVAVVAELSSLLSSDVTWGGVATFCLLFVPVWWVWIGSTFYNDRFESDDVGHRFFTFLLMIPVAGLALNLQQGLGESSQGLAISYVAARSVIVFLWLRGGWHNPEMRPVTNRYAVGFSCSVLLWLISVFVPTPWRFVLWTVGLLIDLVTPFTTYAAQRALPRWSTSHLPERFGLFTIIVLGESVVGVLRGAAAHRLTISSGISATFGLALAFGLWWIYFDSVMSRKTRPSIFWRGGWSYLHLPLVMALTALGAGALNVVSSSGPGLSLAAGWLMAGSAALAFLVIGLIELTLRPDDVSPRLRHLPAIRAGAALLVVVVGLAGPSLSSVVFVGALMAIGWSQVIVRRLLAGYAERDL